MRLYKLYVYEFFDESIGENNSYFQCLTKRFGTENETPDCWLGHISELEISKKLGNLLSSSNKKRQFNK